MRSLFPQVGMRFKGRDLPVEAWQQEMQVFRKMFLRGCPADYQGEKYSASIAQKTLVPASFSAEIDPERHRENPRPSTAKRLRNSHRRSLKHEPSYPPSPPPPLTLLLPAATAQAGGIDGCGGRSL
ncbi:MAG: hypothetical protein ABGY42_12865 [bacterium]